MLLSPTYGFPISRLVQRFLRPPRHFENGESPGDEAGAEAKVNNSGLPQVEYNQGVNKVVPGSYFCQFVL